MTVVSYYFKRLLDRLPPTARQLAVYVVHSKVIERALAGRSELHTVRPIGSQVRGTAVRGVSDRDLLVVFHRAEAAQGRNYVGTDTLLRRVRGALAERFPQTAVRRDKVAIAIEFADGTSVDVVPSIFHELRFIGSRKVPVFLIPDGANQWRESAPDAHAALIDQADEASGQKFRYCIRLLKYWRACRTPTVPISSFHLELLYAHYGTFGRVATYQECLADAFRLLAIRKCAGMRDPLRVSGYVPATKTDAQREDSLLAASYAVEKSQRALWFEQAGRFGEAADAWDLVFNGRFRP